MRFTVFVTKPSNNVDQTEDIANFINDDQAIDFAVRNWRHYLRSSRIFWNEIYIYDNHRQSIILTIRNS